MRKSLISDFGPESKPGGKRATNGGCCDPKPIPYSKPVGPTEQMRARPGLGGTNHGNCGTQGRR